jgi:hypothetical protein
MQSPNLTPANRFAGLAERFVAWMDAWSGTPEENAQTALRFLPELYLEAISLPDTFPDTADDLDDTAHLPRWKTLTTKLRSLPVDGYWKVFSPLKQDEPVQCSLADDLADIYLDLDRGLSYFKKGDTDRAVWEWRFSFWQHWGRHLVGALSALHAFHSFDY